MRSTFISLIIGLAIILIVGFGGYFLVKKFRVSADIKASSQSADLNRDGKVDSLDLNSLLTAISDESENPKFDLNSDGQLDQGDINELMKQWTK